MTKLLRLLLILVIASLMLTACGAPAVQNDAEHGDTAEHTEAEDADHADAEAEDDAEHMEAEDEAASDEEAVDEHEAEDATEDEEDTAEDEADDAEEAADDSAEDTAEDAAEESDDAAAEEADDTAEIRVGDVANGEVIFTQMYTEVGYACATCHQTVSEDRLIGPGLLNTGARAATRVEGQSAEAYIHESIVNPDAYVVADYLDTLMPETYADLLSEDEIADVIAYVLTLEG